jgi:hypothetical protein
MIKRRAIGLMVMSLLALGASHAHARQATITGSVSGPALEGACTEPGYDARCRVGPCECIQILNANVGKVPGKRSIAGKGTANLYLTLDYGAEMPTTPGQEECIPFFGIAELSTARGTTPISETLNLVGVNCLPVTTADYPVLGGFGVSQTPTPPDPASLGFGEMTGFLNSNGELSLTLKGSITK